MSEATTTADDLFGAEHVQRYRETDGEVGHDWHGATVLILTTWEPVPVSARPSVIATERLGGYSSSCSSSSIASISARSRCDLRRCLSAIRVERAMT